MTVVVAALLAHIAPSSPLGTVLTWVGLACCAGAALRFAGVGTGRVPESAAVVLVVAGIATVVAGVAVGDGTPDPSSRPETTGTVRIVAPADGTTLRSDTVALQVDVRDFTLVPLVGGPGTADSTRGHLHVTVDGQVVQMPGDAAAVDVCVPEGEHTIAVVLVAEDHYGYANEPDATDVVTVNGRAGAVC